MARHFEGDNASTDSWIRMTAQGLTAMPYGTLAAVVYLTGINGATAPTIVATGGDVNESFEMYVSNSGGGIALYNGLGSVVSSVIETTNEWTLIAVTKATGTVSPRFHLFRWLSNSWTHNTPAGTAQDASQTGLTEHLIGGLAASVDDMSGEMAAVAAWNKRVLTDSEIERLAAGKWTLSGPDLLVEFASGRDLPTGVCRDISRNRQREAAHANTSRAPRSDPPGFRFCNPRRR